MIVFHALSSPRKLALESTESQARRLRQTASLMVGQPDYDNYLQHRVKTHPDEPTMTREEFFRNRQDSRFGVGNNSGFRCC